MKFSVEALIEMIFELLPYIRVTVSLAVVSFIFALLIGIILAICVNYEIKVLKQISQVYISFFRSTPFISQLFVFYYGFPAVFPIFRGMDANIALLICMSLNEAAFMAEILRGALMSINKGQEEAGIVVGMSKVQIIRRIILPQAFRVAIPGLSNTFISLLKMSSIGFTIGVIEIQTQAKLLGAQAFRIMESYLAALIVYWMLISLISKLQPIIERRLSKAY